MKRYYRALCLISTFVVISTGYLFIQFIYLPFHRKLPILSAHPWNCEFAVTNFQSKKVSEERLKNITDTCLEIAMKTDGNVFNLLYLKKNLKNFRCPKVLQYLWIPNPLVALASYPGSGNTWTRELIETVTEIHTGSVYTDWNFVGSQKCPVRGDVFIVKTHYDSNKVYHPDCKKIGITELKYSKAIYILRNPYHALLAEFNRQNARAPEKATFFNSGVGNAAKELFISERWFNFVEHESHIWKKMTLFWLEKFKKPVHILVYERVRENTLVEMLNLMQFLGRSLTFHSLYCISETTGKYHRVKPQWMEVNMLYDDNLRTIVNTIIQNVIDSTQVSKHITPVLQSYIMPVLRQNGNHS